jgi:predicted nucleic acid-binding Zn ribbon protein
MDREGKRGGPEAIGPIVRDIISRLGMKELLVSSRVFEVWPATVGGAIAGHAQPHSLREGTLIVHVDSSVWLAQLERFRKRQIREKLNRELPYPMVKRIVFRIGELQRPE